MLWILGLGAIAGLWLGYAIGGARARARRALRDLRATRDALSGLARLFASETGRFIGWSVLGVVTLVGCAIAGVVSRGT